MLNIKQAIKLLRRDTEGSGLVEFALIFPVFMILLAGAVDYGRAYYVALDLSAAAQAGALYGSQNPTDTAGMISASREGAAELAGLNATATYGCECPDGSSAVASCTAPPACANNYVNYVDVVATAPYVPIITLPGMPSASTFLRPGPSCFQHLEMAQFFALQEKPSMIDRSTDCPRDERADSFVTILKYARLEAAVCCPESIEPAVYLRGFPLTRSMAAWSRAPNKSMIDIGKSRMSFSGFSARMR
jgi:Flp pilus assembly protein TadG